jgi:hypothetical protein
MHVFCNAYINWKRRVPRQILSLKRRKIVSVSVGSFHVFVIDHENKVYSWGRNDKGQCGRGFTSPYILEPGTVDEFNPDQYPLIISSGQVCTHTSRDGLICTIKHSFCRSIVSLSFASLVRMAKLSFVRTTGVIRPAASLDPGNRIMQHSLTKTENLRALSRRMDLETYLLLPLAVTITSYLPTRWEMFLLMVQGITVS